MDLSGDTLATLRQDSEFVLCRGRATASATHLPPSVLVSMPRSDHPALDHVRMLEHELALSAELDSTWALRPVVLAQHEGRPALVYEDQQGEPLERLLDNSPVSRALSGRRSSQPAMDLGLFLRLAVGLPTSSRSTRAGCPPGRRSRVPWRCQAQSRLTRRRSSRMHCGHAADGSTGHPGPRHGSAFPARHSNRKSVH
jgi:hypothetical protein